MLDVIIFFTISFTVTFIATMCFLERRLTGRWPTFKSKSSKSDLNSNDLWFDGYMRGDDD